MGGFARNSRAKLAGGYRSACKICHRMIRVDQRTEWLRGTTTGLVHAECVPADTADTEESLSPAS